MKCCYHPGYQAEISASHPFPMSKFPLLKERLIEEGIVSSADLFEPQPLDFASMERVHTRAYLDKLEHSGLSVAEKRLLGLPWSESLWARSRLAAGGTLLAARMAMANGLAGNLAGGTHHAFADHVEGFCVVNDVAIAIQTLRGEGAIGRAVVIDLDVHQGNGTADIFREVDEVFTFSMHGERNYPAKKMRSNLDVALPDGLGDHAYLALLNVNLETALDAARADMAFYVAGVDVAAGDRYGRLSLSDAGVSSRDRLVIESVRARALPLVIVLGGGYAPTRARTAELHVNVFREAVAYERSRAGAAPPSTDQPINA